MIGDVKLNTLTSVLLHGRLVILHCLSVSEPSTCKYPATCLHHKAFCSDFRLEWGPIQSYCEILIKCIRAYATLLSLLAEAWSLELDNIIHHWHLIPCRSGDRDMWFEDVRCNLVLGASNGHNTQEKVMAKVRFHNRKPFKPGLLWSILKPQFEFIHLSIHPSLIRDRVAGAAD